MDTIVLPIEIKVRELAGKLWLAAVLADRGYRVAFGKSSSVYRSLDLLDPDIYFTLSAVNHEQRYERLSSLTDCGTRIAVLDTEGSAFRGRKQYRPRVDPTILSMVDDYFAWGPVAASTAVEQAGPDFEERVEITGNPRFDMVQPDLRSVYFEVAEEIADEHGEFVLVNTNFSINHVDQESLWEDMTEDQRSVFRKQSGLIGKFIALIVSITESTDRTVIVRPHPNEDASLYARFFRPFPDVEVIREGDVRPWLVAASAVVHNSCTTAVSSALLRTPVLAYTPGGTTVHKSPIPNIVSEEYTDESTLVGRLTELGCEEIYTLSDNQVAQLKSHIVNIEFRSAKRIADALDSAEAESAGSVSSAYSPPVKTTLRRGALSVIGQDRLESLYYQKRNDSGVSYKFDSLSMSEIENHIEQFPDGTVSRDIEVTPERKALDVFWITGDEGDRNA